jgi:hypothetical protein
MEYLEEELIRFAQHELSDQTPIKLIEDGVIGKKTLRALLYIEQIPNGWDPKRQIIGYIQYLCATEGINGGPIDGWWGPQTEYGYERLRDAHAGKQENIWRDDEGAGAGELVGGNDWPVQTQESLTEYYGDVGENQIKIELPYRMKLSWNRIQTIKNITCHEKVAESVVWVLERVLESYGEKKIKALRLDLYGGGLNVRKMRGGSKWSTHAWGIAFDFYPEMNKLRWGKDKASFARREYSKWWELWESEGWVSLGRSKNYDWMHVQAAKIRKS